MKKIVPFTKDIVFSTSVYEINSISIEHNLKVKNKNIEGDFIISGEYKDTEYSLNSEPFIFNIPADIEVDSRYILDNVKIDIDDFNYNIIDSNTLNINIKLNLDGIEEQEEIIEDIIIEQEERLTEKETDREVTTLFNNIGKDNDNYVNYYVHIFRENDSIENIIKLYNTSKESLEDYNDLSSIITGCKIIIPSIE